MSICFIILHYKKAQETAKCIDSILRMSGSGKMQILVVDNSAGDGSAQAVKEKYCNYDNVHILPSEDAAGFSRANNIGYQYAVRNFNPDFIAAVNDDIEFCQEDFAERLQRVYQQTHFGVLGPDVLHTDTGFHQSPIDTRLRTEKEARATIRKNRVALKLSGVLFPVINRVLEGMHTNQGSRSDIDYGKRSENVVLLGACLFFSREYMDRCEDAFYPETQFFYEEYILKCRCERLGLKMIYDPQIKVLHEGGASTWQSYKDRRKRLKFALYHTMKGCQVYLNYKKGAKFERHCDW